ncbi:MAG: PGF-CTERM sorting domain-containing protein, partial [Halobaculum sp.]
ATPTTAGEETATPTTAAEETTTSTPGFGLVVAVVGLVAATLVARRRN